ncbi:hypothetical protein EVA_10590, partial [gut metagenome]
SFRMIIRLIRDYYKALNNQTTT